MRHVLLRPDVLLASPGDITIPMCVDGGPAILRIIRENYIVWRKAQK
jgi:hypothetical protein